MLSHISHYCKLKLISIFSIFFCKTAALAFTSGIQHCRPLHKAHRLFPVISILLQPDVLCEEYRILSFLTLLRVVVETLQRCVSEYHDHRNIYNDDHSLEHVRSIPYETCACSRSDVNQHCCDQSECYQARLRRISVDDELEAAFAVRIVSDQRSEREQRKSYCKEYRSESSQ